MPEALLPTAKPVVHLVGAGPGDPELLTLKAVRVLRAATVILVDDLVGEQLLDAVLDPAAPSPARRIHVGKRGGCRPATGHPEPGSARLGGPTRRALATGVSTPQAFIDKLMIREAQAGERVVRLKGGDPLVFGRANEEIAALQAAGIAVEVVNGITAGLAAVNALGTSCTDRRSGAQGVLLVIYMGVAQAGRIVAELRQTLPADLPAAVVQNASTGQQRCAIATLGTLVAVLDEQHFGSPAVLVIGRVIDTATAVSMASQARSETRVA